MERNLRSLREADQRNVCGIAAAVIGAGAMTAGAGVWGANKAANTQSKTANQAAQMQMGMFNTIRDDLSPYRNFGAGSLPMLGGLLGFAPATGGGVNPGAPNWAAYMQANPDVLAEYDRASKAGDPGSPAYAAAGLSSPEAYAEMHYNKFGKAEGRTIPLHSAGGPQGGAGMDMQAFLEKIPGYQFARDQGLQAVTNNMSMRGLGGTSGAFGKGIARFVTGLADSTYGDQVNRMMAAATMGQNAAVQTGSAGLNASGNAGSALMGGAAARAAGAVGTANALGNFANSVPTAMMMGGLYGGGGGFGGAAGGGMGGFGTQGTGIPADLAGLT